MKKSKTKPVFSTFFVEYLWISKRLNGFFHWNCWAFALPKDSHTPQEAGTEAALMQEALTWLGGRGEPAPYLIHLYILRFSESDVLFYVLMISFG